MNQFGSVICDGQIVGCRGDSIFVQITQSFDDILYCYDKENRIFTLNFFKNQLNYKVLLNSLEWIKKHGLHEVLINNQLYDQVDYSIPKANAPNDFSCSFCKTLNDEQKSAVQQIVSQQNHGIPILLHGPPGRIKLILTKVFYFNISISYKLGTGKTRTLVASIAEIVRGTTHFVLVLAHSNAASDELTIRLLEILRDGEIFRLYAKSFKKETLNAKIKPISNLENGEFQFPALKYLYKFRVVVSTLFTSGCLVRARGEDPDFDSSHFSRIFIDEAGCIHEPASMIPIAGLYLSFRVRRLKRILYKAIITFYIIQYRSMF